MQCIVIWSSHSGSFETVGPAPSGESIKNGGSYEGACWISVGADHNGSKRRAGGRHAAEGEAGRVRQNLLAVWRGLLLHPGHRYVHSAVRPYSLRGELQLTRNEYTDHQSRRRSCDAHPRSRCIHHALSRLYDRGYPHANGIRHAAHVLAHSFRVGHPGRLGRIGGYPRPRDRYHPVGRLHGRSRRDVLHGQSVDLRDQVGSERLVRKSGYGRHRTFRARLYPFVRQWPHRHAGA